MAPIRTRPKLLRLIAEAVEKFNAMTPKEQDKMVQQQIIGVAKAEASWPRTERLTK